MSEDPIKHRCVYQIEHESGWFYVGRRTSKVPFEREAYWGCSSLKDQVFAGLGKDGWSRKVIQHCSTDKELSAAEQAYIRQTHSHPLNFNIGGVNHLVKAEMILCAMKQRAAERIQAM